MNFTQDEIYRYSRHLQIPQVGLAGQKRLKSASVLIVGAGGLGSPVALYLAAVGVGHIGLVDDDVVELSNLQRQVLYETPQAGKLKVEAGRERLLALNPTIEVDALPSTFNEKTAEVIAEGYDILVDCTDAFSTRALVNDLCVLTGRPEVYGAVYRFEGQAAVFDARKGPCYRCVFPKPPSADEISATSSQGILGVIPGVIGTLMAGEVIKLILEVGSPLTGYLIVYDALEATFQKVKLHQHTDCPVCGQSPRITNIQESASFGAEEEEILLHSEERISPRELAGRLQRLDPVILVDVRDPIEQQVSSIPGALSIPLEELPRQITGLDRHQEIVVFCRNGKRSTWAVKILKENGFDSVRDLTGGINAWIKETKTHGFMY